MKSYEGKLKGNKKKIDKIIDLNSNDCLLFEIFLVKL